MDANDAEQRPQAPAPNDTALAPSRSAECPAGLYGPAPSSWGAWPWGSIDPPSPRSPGWSLSVVCLSGLAPGPDREQGGALTSGQEQGCALPSYNAPFLPRVCPFKPCATAFNWPRLAVQALVGRDGHRLTP